MLNYEFFNHLLYFAPAKITIIIPIINPKIKGRKLKNEIVKAVIIPVIKMPIPIIKSPIPDILQKTFLSSSLTLS